MGTLQSTEFFTGRSVFDSLPVRYPCTAGYKISFLAFVDCWRYRRSRFGIICRSRINLSKDGKRKKYEWNMSQGTFSCACTSLGSSLMCTVLGQGERPWVKVDGPRELNWMAQKSLKWTVMYKTERLEWTYEWAKRSVLKTQTDRFLDIKVDGQCHFAIISTIWEHKKAKSNIKTTEKWFATSI